MMKALSAATKAFGRPVSSYDFCRVLDSAGTFPPLSNPESQCASCTKGVRWCKSTIGAGHNWTEIYRCAARWMLDPVLLALGPPHGSTCGPGQTFAHLKRE